MRYLGSKTSLLNQIGTMVNEYNGGVFCDPFGGIGTVGAFMKQKGFDVITGDILNFAHYFQCVRIAFDETDINNLINSLHLYSLTDLEEFMSGISVSSGWLIEEYAIKRQFFTIDNACHIQACLNCIVDWYENGYIHEKEYIILIVSLIDSFDRVANTAGTYYAYLKQFYRKAIQPFKFKLVHAVSGPLGKSYLKDANELVKEITCDILYLDPPYNGRDYSGYYHLPETVSMGIVPLPMGKSGVYRKNTNKSLYNGKYATDAFENLIENANCRCIIFHYTDTGLIDMNDAKEIMKKKGKHFEEFYFDCRGYSTTEKSVNCKHHIMKVKV